MHVARLVAGAAALSVATFAFAQSAVLHDGTVVIQKVPLELFATEGPIWDIDVANRRIRVIGPLHHHPRVAQRHAVGARRD
jgi:hypothetical protein